MTFRPLSAAVLAAFLFAAPAFAENAEVPPVTDAAAKKECGACHLAFQPKLLSADAWTRIFADLPHHFGEDATLPEATRQALDDYYVKNAGQSQAGLLRISQQSWWLRQHRAVGQNKFVAAKSKANCGACHTGADRGQYEN